MNKNGLGIGLILALVVAAAPVWAQHDMSEASGEVLDREGNPVQGVVITFSPVGNPTSQYKGKTNKKGRFFIPGMWTPQEGDKWALNVELDGWVPVSVTVETRTVNRVLAIPGKTQELTIGTKVTPFPIPKMGKAKVDLVVAPEADVRAEMQQQMLAEAGEGAQIIPSEGGEEAQVQVVQKDPWDEATTLANAGQLEESLPFFVKAIEKEPEDGERYETYAKVLYQLENYDQAQEPARKAVELEPERIDAQMLLSAIYIRSGDLEGARATLTAAQEMAPQDIRVFEQLAFVAKEGGDVDEQIAVYEKLAELNPNNAEAWLALGGLYATQKQMSRSQEAYQKVVDLDPDNAYQTYYNLSVLILNRENPSSEDTSRAIDALRKAVEIKPDYAQAWKQLAFALIGTGERANAADALEKYLEYKPNAPDAGRMEALIASLRG